MVNDSTAGVQLADRNAVVVGGTTGIGRAIALAFADEGANVVATSRSDDAVEDVTAELRERGADTAAVTCDVRDRESLERLRDAAEEAMGSVDVLVNSAGSVAKASVTEMSEEEWNRDIDVCLTGVFRACQVFGAAMDEGSIVNISSMSADQAREERPAYCAAKSGLNGLTRAAAADLAPEVRVNAVAPGFVKTPLAGEKMEEGSAFREAVDDRTPMGRVADPDEIAGSVVHLASDAAAFTTGQVVTVDGGYDISAK
ncbi:SDR family NAD(P)-dependent oxidoreductase [Candidatus Halobonum tyrrellensis]|uniref:3-oxoacyl-ACP reductase n=1 Tax=Candidatus Halobonum tyrrellensis G22 TaxID=1324957 RepID=V4HAM1_9EURY|nr:SDR family oxidoreductase [Candidatus Halobonum tyrrellensis]ESP87103.1 3-oxoacyl-ACP reductase [Candidatus Halobonum tyrrellensis G22]